MSHANPTGRRPARRPFVVDAWHAACFATALMQQPPEPPKLRRWIAAPGRVLSLLLGLAALPALALSGGLEANARASVAHVLLTFVVLTLAFRVIGKRELSRLSPFELVTLMLIPEILSNSVQGQGSLLTSLAGLSAVLLLVVTTSLLSQRFPGVQRALEAPPTLLVADGQLLEQNMNRERISPDELFGEMRKQGLDGLTRIRFAVLESGGNITFVARDSRETAAQESESALR